MSETEDEGARAARNAMETIREYPATDTEAHVRGHHYHHGERKKKKDGIRLVQMYDGSFQLETGNSRTALVDSTTQLHNSSFHDMSQGRGALKKSSSLRNMLNFKRSKSSTTMSPQSS